MLSRRGGCGLVGALCCVFDWVCSVSDRSGWVSWWFVRSAMRLCATSKGGRMTKDDANTVPDVKRSLYSATVNVRGAVKINRYERTCFTVVAM